MSFGILKPGRICKVAAAERLFCVFAVLYTLSLSQHKAIDTRKHSCKSAGFRDVEEDLWFWTCSAPHCFSVARFQCECTFMTPDGFIQRATRVAKDRACRFSTFPKSFILA